MKIIFFGSDDFAVVSADKLLTAGHTILACVTPPDKAKGRGLKIIPSPVKDWAQKHKISVLQPERLRDIDLIDELSAYKSDVFVVIAYGKILPAELLKIPRLGALNVHASLLPKYRGAAPINWAIISGETETGVSVIQMNELMDAGDVLLQKEIKIGKNDNSVTLRAQLAEVGAECLWATLKLFEYGKTHLAKQNLSAVTMAPKLTKELGIIEWNKSADEIHNLIRGLLPWPMAHSSYKGKMVKVLETVIIDASAKGGQPGEVLEVSARGILVATGRGQLLMTKVHPESGKVMDARSFAVGHGLVKGGVFG